MLVYANSFSLGSDTDVSRVIATIAEWIGKSRKCFVDPIRLERGVKELRLVDGATVSSLATIEPNDEKSFPYLFCARLTHGQEDVPGRKWTAEVGIQQANSDAPVFCSVVLRTDEISARVNTPIQVTRPAIVQRLTERFIPISETPGLKLISLDENNADAFRYEIDHPNRTFPIVQVSCDRNGIFPVGAERLRGLAVGLAKVIEIGPNADTWKIEEVLGRKFSCFGGAVNIIFPPRESAGLRFCRTYLLRPDYIQAIFENGGSVESEILSSITHYTNVPHSWNHKSKEMVAQEILRNNLRHFASRAAGPVDISVYEDLLQDAANQMQNMTEEVEQLRLEVEDYRSSADAASDLLELAQAEVESLKYSLASIPKGTNSGGTQETAGISDLRRMVISAISGDFNLSTALILIRDLYPDRLVVLDSALDSAKRSDAGGFKYQKKALDLLHKLVEDYWSSLSAGNSDQQAKTCFGKDAYSAKESDSISSDGLKRRTFGYNGKSLQMQRHLKIGVKDSLSDTLRAHFEWLPDEKKIVIGHCGKHLDF